MRGVILGAGEGERLQRGGSPKILSLFHDGMLLARQVRYLRSYGVTDVTATLLDRWANEPIVVAREYGFRISFEKRTHGTAGSLVRAVPADDSVVVLLGDVVTDLDVGAVIDALKSSHAVVAVYEDDWSGKGAVFTGDKRRIVAFEEKPTRRGRGLVCAGVYAFRPSVLRLCEGRFVDLGQDVLPQAIKAGFTVRAVETDRPVIGIDTVDKLLEARRLAQSEGFAW